MASKLMHAVQYDSYGGGASALKHVEAPVPSPKKGEVLLKLEAAALNPVDWKIQKGMLRPFFPRKFPHIPGGYGNMASKLMHAVQYDSYGGGASALKHVEAPVPSPKKGEALLKLEAAALNPVDWKIQKGMLRPFFPRKFPHIPVTDVAGEM